MRKAKESRSRRRSVREILHDRALMAAFLFSAAVHLVVFFQVKFPLEDPALKTGRLMIARLVRLPAANTGEEEAVPLHTGPAGIDRDDQPTAAAAAGSAMAGGGKDDKIGVAATGGGATAFRAARVSGGLSLSFSSPAPALERRHSSAAVVAGGKALAVVARMGPPERSVNSLLNEIRRLIDTRKVYPRIAMRNGWEGRVLVELSLADGGALEDVRIVDASGHRVLDSATVRAVRSAGPYPPLEGKVRVPVTYRLDR